MTRPDHNQTAIAAATLAREFPTNAPSMIAEALHEAGFDTFGSDDHPIEATVEEWLDSARGWMQEFNDPAPLDEYDATESSRREFESSEA